MSRLRRAVAAHVIPVPETGSIAATSSRVTRPVNPMVIPVPETGLHCGPYPGDVDGDINLDGDPRPRDGAPLRHFDQGQTPCPG